MKKLLKRIAYGIMSICCLVSAASFIACNNNEQNSSSSDLVSSSIDSSIEKEKLFLNYSVLVMASEEVQQMEVLGREETPVWTSSNLEVVKVDETGRLIALSEGKATITAKIGEIEGTCNITVVSTGLVASIEFPDFDDEKLELLKGSTFRINPKMTLRGEEVTYYTFTYTVVGEAGIIQVDDSGLVTAVESGGVLVTIQAKHNFTGNISDQKTIQVIVK